MNYIDKYAVTINEICKRVDVLGKKMLQSLCI